jgi:hypothetical protein
MGQLLPSYRPLNCTRISHAAPGSVSSARSGLVDYRLISASPQEDDLGSFSVSVVFSFRFGIFATVSYLVSLQSRSTSLARGSAATPTQSDRPKAACNLIW